jgi:hypothetical protein
MPAKYSRTQKKASFEEPLESYPSRRPERRERLRRRFVRQGKGNASLSGVQGLVGAKKERGS